MKTPNRYSEDLRTYPPVNYAYSEDLRTSCWNSCSPIWLKPDPPLALWGSENISLKLMSTNLIKTTSNSRPCIPAVRSENIPLKLMSTNLIKTRSTSSPVCLQWGSENTLLKLMSTNLIHLPLNLVPYFLG